MGSMRPAQIANLSRRALLAAVTTSAVLLSSVSHSVAQAPGQSLPSWNDGLSKQAMLDFVHATTERSSRHYVAPVYQPMREVMELLRVNGFKTYIVTGGGQDFGE